MPLGIQNLDDSAEETGTPGVFLVALGAVDFDEGPLMINGDRVVALAPHPDLEDLLYLTTTHRDALAFLPDVVLDLTL